MANLGFWGPIALLVGSIGINGCLMVSLWTRSAALLSVTTSDKVQTVILASFNVVASSLMFLSFGLIAVSVALICMFAKLKSWEDAAGE